MTIPAAPDGAQPDAPISDYYAKVPRSVLTDPRLSDRAVRLWALLDSHLVGKPWTIKVATLAAEMGATVRSTERALAELVALGYVTRSRTRYVSVTAVNNPLRSAKSGKRSDTGGGSDPTQVADRTRTRPSRTINNNKGGAAPAPAHGSPAPTAPLDPAAAGGYLEPYLRAVIEGAGVEIELNRRVNASLETIAASGISPARLRELVAGWPRISWSGEPIHRLGGFIVGVVLPGIAQGQSAPTAAPAQQTPTPPPYVPEPDLGGDPVAGIALARAALRAQEIPA